MYFNLGLFIRLGAAHFQELLIDHDVTGTVSLKANYSKHQCLGFVVLPDQGGSTVIKIRIPETANWVNWNSAAGTLHGMVVFPSTHRTCPPIKKLKSQCTSCKLLALRILISPQTRLVETKTEEYP